MELSTKPFAYKVVVYRHRTRVLLFCSQIRSMCVAHTSRAKPRIIVICNESLSLETTHSLHTTVKTVPALRVWAGVRLYLFVLFCLILDARRYIVIFWVISHLPAAIILVNESKCAVGFEPCLLVVFLFAGGSLWPPLDNSSSPLTWLSDGRDERSPTLSTWCFSIPSQVSYYISQP